MFAALEFGLASTTWPWIWLGIAVVLALVELLAVPGSFLLLPWSVSALVASLMAFAGLSNVVQWLAFVFVGAAVFVALYRWARRSRDADPHPPGMGADRLVGLEAVVTVAIDPADPSRSGRVAVEGESWGAISDDEPIAVGTPVVVTEMRGTRVVVAEAPASGLSA